jgi:rubrerythrin
LASTKSIQQPLYDYEAAYRDAYDFEQESIRLYSTALEKSSDQKEQQQLTRIIDEEKKHAQLMDSLCEFVKKPKEWLENAEWHHLDEY